MHWKKAFPGEHLEAADIPMDGYITVRIDNVDTTVLDGENGKKDPKMLITFTGPASVKKSTWIAPKTSGALLAAMFGELTESWVGKRVCLAPMMVNAFGEDVLAVRPVGSPDLAKGVRAKCRQGRKKVSFDLRPMRDNNASPPKANGQANGTAAPITPERIQKLAVKAQEAADNGVSADVVRQKLVDAGLDAENADRIIANVFPDEGVPPADARDDDEYTVAGAA